MLDIVKHLDFFDPTKISEPIHIIGCGAIGSHLAELFARLGVENINLWDFDTVEGHNIANQNFKESDIGKMKVEAVRGMMLEINKDNAPKIHAKGWNEDAVLSGWVFLAVDNIDTRRSIVEENKDNPYVKGFCDIRMGLTDSQIYFAIRKKEKEIDQLLSTMNFSHEEAKENVPVSACGTTLSIIPTIKFATSMAVSNWINYNIDEDNYYNFLMTDAFSFILDKFKWKN